jgi:hypothetical protein
MKDKKHIKRFNESDENSNVSDVSHSFTIEDLKKAFEDGRKYTTDAFNEEHWDFDYDNFKSWYSENYD